MESIVLNVRDIDQCDRPALEHVVGRTLRDNQKLIIQLAENEIPEQASEVDSHPKQTLADWTSFYEGLSDDEVEEIDKIIKTRANLTRYLP